MSSSAPLTGFVLLECITVWCRICYDCIHVWAEELLVLGFCFFQFPSDFGVWFCTFPLGFCNPWEKAHLSIWPLNNSDSIVWDRGRGGGDAAAIRQRSDVVVCIVCHLLLFQLLVSGESFHWLGKMTSQNGQSSSFLCRRFPECYLIMGSGIVCP